MDGCFGPVQRLEVWADNFLLSLSSNLAEDIFSGILLKFMRGALRKFVGKVGDKKRFFYCLRAGLNLYTVEEGEEYL